MIRSLRRFVGYNANMGPTVTYIADISSYAGQLNATLKFEKSPGHPDDNPSEHGMVDLDGIRFVPEPCSSVLFGLGILSFVALFGRRHAARKRR